MSGRVNRLFDDLVEAGSVRGERAAYIGVSGAHLPGHIAGRHQTPVLIRSHRAGNIQRFVDQHGLRIAEVLFVGVQVKYLLDPQRRRLRFALAGASSRSDRGDRPQPGIARAQEAGCYFGLLLHEFSTGAQRTQHLRQIACAAPRARSSAAPRSPAPDPPHSARSYSRRRSCSSQDPRRMRKSPETRSMETRDGRS